MGVRLLRDEDRTGKVGLPVGRTRRRILALNATPQAHSNIQPDRYGAMRPRSDPGRCSFITQAGARERVLPRPPGAKKRPYRGLGRQQKPHLRIDSRKCPLQATRISSLESLTVVGLISPCVSQCARILSSIATAPTSPLSAAEPRLIISSM